MVLLMVPREHVIQVARYGNARVFLECIKGGLLRSHLSELESCGPFLDTDLIG